MVDGDSFCFSSVIRGHRIYKSVWSPVVGEVLELRPEDTCTRNMYVHVHVTCYMLHVEI